MKKKITVLLSSLLMMTIITSCEDNFMQEEQFNQETKSSQLDPSDATETKTILSFDSEEQMKSEVFNLMSLSEEERTEWYNANGDFVSQNNFMWQVIEELYSVQSMEEAKVIQSKYADLFLFNQNDSDKDVSPYLPSSHKSYDLVCTKYGNVIIAGDTVNFNNLTSFEQTRDYEVNQLIKQRRTIMNGVYVKDGKRKMWAEAYDDYINGREWVTLKLQGHKSIWGVWHKYKTSYGIRITNYDNWEFTQWFTHQIQNASLIYGNYYNTGTIPSGDFRALYLRRRVDQTKQAKFTMSVYSRGVGVGNVRTFTVTF